ncbi:MAG TPA: hypothetical protein VLL98_04350 [Rickettsiales bacterium]|nr:hypothetical protein [Rickettsiales bacterium]
MKGKRLELEDFIQGLEYRNKLVSTGTVCIEDITKILQKGVKEAKTEINFCENDECDKKCLEEITKLEKILNTIGKETNKKVIIDQITSLLDKLYEKSANDIKTKEKFFSELEKTMKSFDENIIKKLRCSSTDIIFNDKGGIVEQDPKQSMLKLQAVLKRGEELNFVDKEVVSSVESLINNEKIQTKKEKQVKLAEAFEKLENIIKLNKEKKKMDEIKAAEEKEKKEKKAKKDDIFLKILNNIELFDGKHIFNKIGRGVRKKYKKPLSDFEDLFKELEKCFPKEDVTVKKQFTEVINSVINSISKALNKKCSKKEGEFNLDLDFCNLKYFINEACPELNQKSNITDNEYVKLKQTGISSNFKNNGASSSSNSNNLKNNENCKKVTNVRKFKDFLRRNFINDKNNCRN